MKKTKDSEKDIEKALRVKIKALGGHALKFSSCIESGYPDRIVLLPGGVLSFVELKSEGEKPRKLQTIRHAELRDLGFHVEVIDTIDGLNRFIDDCKTIVAFEHVKSKL